MIDRIRRQPIYLPCLPPDPAMCAVELPNAAVRLRSQAVSPAPTMTEGDPTPLDVPSTHLP